MRNEFTRRQFVGLATSTMAATAGVAASSTPSEPAATFENQHLRFSIDAGGRAIEFLDKRTGVNHVRPGEGTVAAVQQSGKAFSATSVNRDGERLALAFGDSGVRAVLKVSTLPNYFLVEVESIEGPADELILANIPLKLAGAADEAFAGSVLALNLKTNVAPLPGAMSRLTATAYRRFGIPGAKAAIIGCPTEKLRQVLQEVVAAAPELPHSPLGGPWALGKPINQGSYLFNFDGVTVETADAWIDLAKRLGMTQIDFHTGSSLRFGDCRPNPARYPRGFADVKAAIDKLHAAGIKAGLHTYAFFIARDCPWVTPVPDPRLAKGAAFTLSAALDADAKDVSVKETTEAMSAVTGFNVRNSATLQIDDELIVYSGVSKIAPHGFTGCQRGAWGTKAAAHAKGATAHHLKECFHRFAPDPDSTLFMEVAAKTAEAYNACGFDMIYLDALDGSDVLAGGENAWHYGAKFTYEICKRLARPALMEMSTFHHHLWCVRSRYCAWDHPVRSYKKFIDMHCQSQESVNRRMFMPGELGWWALKNREDSQNEPTHADDIEYLMGRCLGTDSGFALMGISPANVDAAPALPRLAEIIKRYEDLRHSGKVSEAMKARLRVPGDEYALVGDVASGWHFLPVRYDTRRVAGAEEYHSVWKTDNRFGPQPLRVRIEALMGAGPYDAPGNITLTDFTDSKTFTGRMAAPKVTLDLQSTSELVKAGKQSGRLTAANARDSRDATWCMAGKSFTPTANLAAHQALGVWIHGDGQGELLNVQLTSPSHVSDAAGHHYVDIDFTGWRYFELIEPEGRRYDDFRWPSGSGYAVYRCCTDYGQIESLALWFNHLPPKGKVACHLSPIQAMPLVASKLVHPSVTVGRQTITFPVDIPTSHYLEFEPGADAKLYGPQGQLIREVKPQGDAPPLVHGSNEIRFQCQTPNGLRPRANVTVITRGEKIA